MEIKTLTEIVDPEFHEYLNGILNMCNAPYAVENGIELVEIGKDAVKMRKEVRPSDLNSNGVVHGAVSFGLMDHAFAVIGNIKSSSVGLSCDVIYHRPCNGPVMMAEAKIINESRTLMTVCVSLFSNERLIATATCVGFKTKGE